MMTGQVLSLLLFAALLWITAVLDNIGDATAFLRVDDNTSPIVVVVVVGGGGGVVVLE
jgi:hypothetical protein